MDSKVYEYESLIYEAGGQGSGDGQGTGIKEGCAACSPAGGGGTDLMEHADLLEGA